MKIRHADKKDLPAILEIFDSAKKYMRANGNLTQWTGNYPNEEVLENDINKNQLYVVCDENNILCGVFAFIVGEDVTYKNIEGSWLNDEPYGTIHRIASNGRVRGIMNMCIDYCKTKCTNIRIDTHEDNTIMQKLILKNNFKYCGIIYIADGSPRLAYHYNEKNN